MHLEQIQSVQRFSKKIISTNSDEAGDTQDCL